MAIQDDPPAGVPEWVVTYGDMMSLLLTFFIMLVSMSEIKESDGKYRRMMTALREVFGPDRGQFSAPGASLQTTGLLDKLASLGLSSDGGTKRTNRKGPGPGGAFRAVRRIRNGAVVTLGGPAFFPDNGSEISDDMKTDLDAIVEVIRTKSQRVEVRGHASPEPLPPGSKHRDNLDLSFARAYAAARYLRDNGIDPMRIRVSAAGDAEPRAATPAMDVRAINRRVDVFLIDTYITPSDSRKSASP
jgi:chemotaxis protein MotB